MAELFRFSGYMVTRTPRVWFAPRKSNLVVEFTGPPGAGKSTLLKALAKRAGGFSFRSIPTTQIGDLEFWEIELLLARLRRDLEEERRGRIDKNIERIRVDSEVRNLRGVALVEEGVFMHWQLELIALRRENPEAFYRMIDRRVVINVCTDSEDICKYIADREERTGKVWSGHAYLGQAEILAYHEEASDSAMEVAEIVRDAGGMAVDVFTRDGLEGNVKLLEGIIHEALERSSGAGSWGQGW